VQGLNCPSCAKRIMVQQVKGKPKERTFVPVV
jgi:DNA-directed RNA polymerase subunit RPC12/RpoP